MRLTRIFLATALTAFPVLPQGNSASDVELQKAIRKETVDGDLKAAIELYRKLARSSDAALAAQALLRLAECQEKQGSAEAKRTYEELLRRYPNRQEALLAKRRLGGGEAAALVVRKIWDGPRYGNTGRPSPDGRYISFTRWIPNAELAVYDTHTGRDWDITKRPGTEFTMAMDGIFSPDGNEIAYSWENPDKTFEIRVAPRDGGASKAIFKSGKAHAMPFAWSKDKKRILARIPADDTLSWISVADGSLAVVTKMPWTGGAGRAYLPDAQYIAFDRVKEGTAGDLDVMLVPASGGAATALMAEPNVEGVMGWTPAGDHVLVASNRTGSMSAWMAPVRNGRPAGEPVLVKDHMGDVIPMDFDNKGTLYYNINPGGTHRVFISDIDPGTGKATKPTLINARHMAGSWRPVFSPKGDSVVLHRIARQSRSIPSGAIIVNLANGSEQQASFPGGGSFLWRGDGVLFGLRRSGERMVYATVPFDGSAPVDVDFSKAPAGQVCSGYRVGSVPDGQQDRYVSLDSGATLVAPFRSRNLRFSPDCSLAAWIQGDTLYVAAARQAAEKREVLRAPAGRHLSDERGSVEWAPDGKQLYFVQYRDFYSDYELWSVPAAGGTPVFTEVKMPDIQQLTIHPGGGRIAFTSVLWNYEAWAIDNILPGKQTTRR